MIRRPRLGPVTRIVVGLVAITGMLVIALDLLLGALPTEADQARRERGRVAALLVAQVATTLEQPDARALLLRTLHGAVAADPQIVSIGVRRLDGSLLAATGHHAQQWVPPADGRSTLTQVVVDILADGRPWGRMELRFVPLASETTLGWLTQPAIAFVLLLGAAGALLYGLFLRRVLQHLDPSAAVPERVKSAFDTLTEAVMIVDARGRIVLANRAFERLHPEAAQDRLGRPASAVPWLVAGLPRDPALHAWAEVMAHREPITGEVLAIPQPDGGTRRLVLNASPIVDGVGQVRGALVTFDDVTELERMNDQLRGALTALEASRQEIEAKNRELTELATRDPMTGCFNRRAFFAAFDPIFARARSGGRLCVLMTDIDHFKSFNDRFGHAVGDLVIKSVAKALGATLRPQDVLGRYGGEEFCILLPDLDPEQALLVAERLRLRVEQTASSSIEGHELPRITSSFGIATLADGAPSPQLLLEQADGALYIAKRNGRNRVERWRADESALTAT